MNEALKPYIEAIKKKGDNPLTLEEIRKINQEKPFWKIIEILNGVDEIVSDSNKEKIEKMLNRYLNQEISYIELNKLDEK